MLAQDVGSLHSLFSTRWCKCIPRHDVLHAARYASASKVRTWLSRDLPLRLPRLGVVVVRAPRLAADLRDPACRQVVSTFHGKKRPSKKERVWQRDPKLPDVSCGQV